ncbi:hypothetical protein C4571_00670 [Candidatus Parcubacteria bacterium]|nr:MAG: hypothetical protein C4571_00670 [Candidatus Parcubacteria bacterium]
MNSALVYLVYRFFYRLGDFFHHWYADASRVILHRYVLLLEQLDRTFALRVTLKYFFQPLYKDYTVVGRILGIIFRSGRVLIGLAVYAVLTAILIVIYLVWLLVPLAILFYVAYAY